MKQLGIICLLIICCTAVIAQDSTKFPIRLKYHFSEGAQDTTVGYTQVMRVGQMIYVSGTVTSSIDSASVMQLYAVLELSLRRFGGSLQQVVKETVYTTDMEAWKKMIPIRKTWYKGDYPTASWVEVKGLFVPEAKLEIEVMAQVQ